MLTQALHGGKASELAVRRKEAQWEQVLTLLALLVQKYNPEASKVSAPVSPTPRGGGTVGAGTHFTCFTGTKLQILMLQAPAERGTDALSVC